MITNSHYLEDKEELIIDIMEFTNQSREEVINKIEKGSDLIKEEWNYLNPKTDEQVLRFYENTPNYIYDLAYWHLSARREFDVNLIKVIRKLLETNEDLIVLDYGCGIAQNSILLEKYTTLKYNYAVDLLNNHLEFAKYRIKKHNKNISIGETKAINSFFNNNVNVILCFDVLEHLTDNQFRETLTLFKKLLKSKGKLLYSASFGTNEIHPFHFNCADWKMKLLEEFDTDVN